MKKFFYNWLNPKQKELNRWNANYFYVSTLIFACALIITFFCFRPQIDAIVGKNIYWNILFVVFKHDGWLHIFGNLECLIVVSLFLERHFGSLKYFAVLCLSILISPFVYFAFTGFDGQGESLVNYFLFGLFFIVVAFNFKNYVLKKWQNIFTVVIVFLIILLSSFDVNSAGALSFSFLTTLLTLNHGSAFLTGIVVGLFSYLVGSFKKRKE